MLFRLGQTRQDSCHWLSRSWSGDVDIIRLIFSLQIFSSSQHNIRTVSADANASYWMEDGNLPDCVGNPRLRDGQSHVGSHEYKKLYSSLKFSVLQL